MRFILRHKIVFSLLAFVLVVATGLALWANRQLHRIEPLLRERIVAALEARFHAHVDLDGFHLSLLHGIEAEGGDLRIAAPLQVQASTPLIQVDHFSFHTGLDLTHLAWMLVHNQGEVHIPLIYIDGLSIHLPPHSHFSLHDEQHTATDPTTPHLQFIIEKLQCKNASLVIGTDKPGKDPLDFDINTLDLTNISPGQPMHFEAQLHIPRPAGTVKTIGSLGPWVTADLGELPLEGNYVLEQADLGVFKGIAGKLDSTGHYEGTLRSLSVAGITTTPGFRLTHFGNTLPLKTVFKAQVDATNGDTHLDDVTATLGRSQFKVNGDILRMPSNSAIHGHDIKLITSSLGTDRVEDFLLLTSRKPETLLTGDLTFNALFHLPPGAVPLHQRMIINGNFKLTNALFTSANIQNKIRELSLRGQGKPDAIQSTDSNSILSSMNGGYLINNAILTLPGLTYQVPGANVQFRGTYLLDGGEITLDGTAKLDARLSQMTTGWKSTLLQNIDGLLSHDGAGTQVPIKIEGTRQKPKVSIDFGRLLKP
jgi:hypothetical protein